MIDRHPGLSRLPFVLVAILLIATGSRTAKAEERPAIAKVDTTVWLNFDRSVDVLERITYRGADEIRGGERALEKGEVGEFSGIEVGDESDYGGDPPYQRRLTGDPQAGEFSVLQESRLERVRWCVRENESSRREERQISLRYHLTEAIAAERIGGPDVLVWDAGWGVHRTDTIETLHIRFVVPREARPVAAALTMPTNAVVDPRLHDQDSLDVVGRDVAPADPFIVRLRMPDGWRPFASAVHVETLEVLASLEGGTIRIRERLMGVRGIPGYGVRWFLPADDSKAGWLSDVEVRVDGHRLSFGEVHGTEPCFELAPAGWDQNWRREVWPLVSLLIHTDRSPPVDIDVAFGRFPEVSIDGEDRVQVFRRYERGNVDTFIAEFLGTIEVTGSVAASVSGLKLWPADGLLRAERITPTTWRVASTRPIGDAEFGVWVVFSHGFPRLFASGNVFGRIVDPLSFVVMMIILVMNMAIGGALGRCGSHLDAGVTGSSSGSSSLGSTWGRMWRLLTFRSRREELLSLDWSALPLGLFVTWVVGMGRWWDDPAAGMAQRLGLGSVAYIFFLAFLLWIISLAWSTRDVTFQRILVFVSWTAAPAILYAVPVEMLMSGQNATMYNNGALAVVASWRAALLLFFLRRLGRLDLPEALVMTLMPLGSIVWMLLFTNLAPWTFIEMAGHRGWANIASGVFIWLVAPLDGLAPDERSLEDLSESLYGPATSLMGLLFVFGIVLGMLRQRQGVRMAFETSTTAPVSAPIELTPPARICGRCGQEIRAGSVCRSCLLGGVR